MTTITLAGMQYRAHSPSLFELQVPGHETLWLACDGPGCWLIGLRGTWATQEFGSRQEAAQLVAEAFQAAGVPCSG